MKLKKLALIVAAVLMSTSMVFAGGSKESASGEKVYKIGVVQLVERWSPKPNVAGSIPAAPVKSLSICLDI